MSTSRLTVAQLAEQVALQGRQIAILIHNQNIIGSELCRHEQAIADLHQRLGAGVLQSLLEARPRDSD